MHYLCGRQLGDQCMKQTSFCLYGGDKHYSNNNDYIIINDMIISYSYCFERKVLARDTDVENRLMDTKGGRAGG